MDIKKYLYDIAFLLSFDKNGWFLFLIAASISE